MANPPTTEVHSEWNKKTGDGRGVVNAATAQTLIDDLDKLLQQHCQQLAERMDAQHALLQRLAAAAATTPNQSCLEPSPLKVAPDTVANESLVPKVHEEEQLLKVAPDTVPEVQEEEEVEELHSPAPGPTWGPSVTAALAPAVAPAEDPACAQPPGSVNARQSAESSVSSGGPPAEPPRASVATDDTAEISSIRGAMKRRSTDAADAVRSHRSHASFTASENARQHELRNIVKGRRSGSSEIRSRGRFRERLTRFVSSCFFEGCSCCLILTSLLFFGVETEYMAQNRIEHIPEGFTIFSQVVAVLFTIELALHLVTEGWSFWTSEFWFSNVIDVVIVVVTLLQIILDLVLDQDGNRTNLTQIRVIRLVRTIRVLRVVRIMKFFRSLRILVYSVLNTLKSLLWVMFMLLVIIYIFALLFTQAANEEIVQIGPGDEADALARYFGSLGRSIYTLFKVITGGLNWEHAAAPLESIGLTWMLVFVSFVAFNYLALLNVVMGLVCQTAIESAYHDLDVVVQTQLSYQEEYTKKFKALFKSIDLEDTGILTLKDLEERLQDPWLQDYFAAMDLTTIEAWTLFKLLDANDSAEIDVDEFVSGCLKLRGNARSIDMHMLMYESKWMLKQMSNFARRQKKQEFMLGEQLDSMNLQSRGQSIQSRQSKPSRGHSSSGFIGVG